MNRSQPINCYNCDQKIGPLDTPYVYQDHVVCGSCYNRISAPPVDTHKWARTAALLLTLVMLCGWGTSGLTPAGSLMVLPFLVIWISLSIYQIVQKQRWKKEHPGV